MTREENPETHKESCLTDIYTRKTVMTMKKKRSHNSTIKCEFRPPSFDSVVSVSVRCRTKTVKIISEEKSAR